MKSLALTLSVLFGSAVLAAAAPGKSSMETQLAGIQLGKKADVVAKAYGKPRRLQMGFLVGPGLQFAWNPKGVPGFTTILPELVGGGGGGMGGSSEGGSGGSYGPPGGSGYPGGPGAPMGGPEGSGGGAAAAPPPLPETVYWIYEQDRQGVVTVFSFDIDGRVSAITVGDGFEDSVNRGGSHRPKATAVTARGIKIGDGFGQVIRTYGHPEHQIMWGDEIVLTYYDRFGVAFSVKQGVMKVTSITIRRM